MGKQVRNIAGKEQFGRGTFGVILAESVTLFLDSERRKEYFFRLGVGFFWECVNKHVH